MKEIALWMKRKVNAKVKLELLPCIYDICNCPVHWGSLNIYVLLSFVGFT